MMNKPILKTWLFSSSSNPDKTHETTQYTDGTTSCQCMGWTRRCNNGVRSCTHTRKVEMGVADREAVSVWNNPDMVDVNLQGSPGFTLDSTTLKPPGFTLDSTTLKPPKKSNTEKLANIKAQLSKKPVAAPKRVINWR
jgi:hypothetical protein